MVPWTSFHYLKRQADVTVHCLGTDAGYRSTCQCQEDKYISYPRLKNLHFWGLPFTMLHVHVIVGGAFSLVSWLIVKLREFGYRSFTYVLWCLYVRV
ncbi:Atypical chemokine receptor 3 [Frankliniella fusca]|uniref:Atypical chemokine receptor 3 n=1 Tax=Frankliniella fusca TaxID=407009 RepID=A0AAE1HJ34_9NEOP|nr:Atypical chemokine receptor 3 [Frankliniella fusca]